MKTTTRIKSLIFLVFTVIGTLSASATNKDSSGNPAQPLTNNESSTPWFAQIWNENFTGLTDGTTADTGTTGWTSSTTSGTFEVQGGLMFFQGINGGSNATWVSEDIDISNHTNVSISYVVADALDGEKETSDYVNGYYVLDNGSRVAFGNVTDDVPTPVNQSVSGLNGSTLRIEIDFRVSYGNETYTIDDVLVEGTPAGDTQAPSTPTGLAGTASSTTAIDLSWNASTDNVGVTGYKIFRDNIEIESNWSSTGYTAVGLTEATSYDFKVRAFDAAGNESSDSNVVSVTTNSASSGGSGVWTESGSTASYTGEVAVGRSTVPSGYKLAVEGFVRAREIRVDQDSWPDYVFEKDYDLPSLEEIRKHIQEKGHLPKMPSAKEVTTHGIKLGMMNKLLLEKIEELTLHIILLEERIKKLEKSKN